MKIIKNPSPNFENRPPSISVNLLLFHYTGMKSASEAIARLCNPNSKVSAHYLIDEVGNIFSLVAENKRAWHAGVASWNDDVDINNISVGVEIANPGHEFGYSRYPERQMIAVETLSIDIIERHSIRAARVLAHSDVSPSRKCDPGELFDWERLAAAGIGIWPKMSPISVDFEIGSIRQCQKQLKMIGYGLKITGVLDELTRDTILAFQRHWLPNRLTGKFDAETVWRMESVLRASE
jgi:N-acetylmuramoyl-L-alanine amidase